MFRLRSGTVLRGAPTGAHGRGIYALCITAFLMAGAPIQHVLAQATRTFDIPAESLGDALLRFGQEAGVQMSVESKLVTGKQAAALHGSYTTEEGLHQLLSGTGLAARFTGPNIVTIEAVPGSRVLNPVKVEGQTTSPYGVGSVGVNGSTDVTATEGSGSLSTEKVYAGAMHAESVKDIPQTVSVITAQRIEDQGITDLSSALAQMPGISQQSGLSALESASYSRGFQLGRTMVDGGVSRNSLSGTFGYYGGEDLAPYDHVEFLNGPDGFSNGYNSPAGTVNLVHKHALDHDQFTTTLQTGSFDMWRVEADATGPVAFDGRVRARADIAKENENSFINGVYVDRTVVFATVEADVTSKTLLTVSNTYLDVDELVPGYALPRYLSGAPLPLPRSTCLCFPWGTESNVTRTLDASLQQKFGSNWNAKLSGSWQRQAQLLNEVDMFGAVNDYGGAGFTLYDATQNHSQYDSKTADLKVTGSFPLFGRRQEVSFGGNYEHDVENQIVFPYDIPDTGVPIDALHFNPSVVPQPALSDSPSRENRGFGQKQYGANAAVSLSFIDPMKLMLGARWQRYEFDSTIVVPPANLTFGPYAELDSFTGASYAALTWAFSKELTSYISWADVLASNYGDLQPDGSTVPPTHGGTYELGTKFAKPGGKLTVTASLYRTELKDLALFVAPGPGGDGFYGMCCYSTANNERELSYGAFFDAVGQILPGWQADLSWEWNVNRYQGSASGSNEGHTIEAYQPRNIVKLWNSYTPQLPGWNRVTASIGIISTSKQTNMSTACSIFLADPTQGCAPDGMTPYAYSQPSYTLVNLQLAYKLSEHWRLSTNVDNLFNRLYWSSFQDNSSFNQYGAPLTWKLSLNGKF
jgi:outer-membrane receptor for ferric coprogen and ferric-rhodotorulic acid